MAFSRPPYIKSHGVKSHPGNVLALAVAEDSKILASGGYEGTRLWSTNTMAQLKRPSAAGSRGATVSLLWVRQTDEPRDVLYSGTQNGYFFAWRQVDEIFQETFAIQMTHAGEITGLGFDTTNNRLCVCSRNDVVQSWSILKDPLTGKWTAQNIFTQKYSNLSPSAIMFDAFDNTKDRNIIVFGLHNNGPVYTLDGKTGELASEWSTGARIGDAIVNWREGMLCLDDPGAGPTLFHVTNQAKSRVFEIPREMRYEVRPRRVRFAESGLAVVSGSDHGVVYVFETHTGDVLQKLDIGVSQWVQAVATTEMDGVPVIFAALTCGDGRWEEIFMWKRGHDNSIGWSKVGTFVKVLVVLGCLAFIYQNLGGYIEAWISPPVAVNVTAGPELERVIQKVGQDVGKDTRLSQHYVRRFTPDVGQLGTWKGLKNARYARRFTPDVGQLGTWKGQSGTWEKFEYFCDGRIPKCQSLSAPSYARRMFKYCKCKYVSAAHELTPNHAIWVRAQKQQGREVGEQPERRPLNMNDIVGQTMHLSLADDMDPALSEPSGDNILSAVMDAFEAVLTQSHATKPTPKQPTREEQSDELLRVILRDIEKTTRSLDPARIALHLDPRKAVDTAAEELAMYAKALQAFADGAEEKIFVVNQLRVLENLVDRLREDLPPDTSPYYYNCGRSLRSQYSALADFFRLRVPESHGQHRCCCAAYGASRPGLQLGYAYV
ncbi:WD40-repeat-containing domain protein [Mycena galopus ATCC 62051]|nr:WD40-repeat-containing domain protein [Mycena galopus ATCC 62051]